MTKQIPRAALGVCCACQSVHFVSKRPDLPPQELEDPMGPYGCGDAGFFQMDAHRIFGDNGSWCEGEKTTPQTILVENNPPSAAKHLEAL